MTDPFLITGPALISFSGGRTSAYMLWRILQAHGGTLPDDVVVAFANTGKEREETLLFVQECADHWGVGVRWIEWLSERPAFVEVDFGTASRNGEPFAALIEKRGIVPNVAARFCSVTLKVRAFREFARTLEWKHWVNIIGLRFDEGHRVLSAERRNASNKEPFKAAMPLAVAGVTKRDVEAFWAAQNFNLQLRPYEGNCDLCFLKSRPKLIQLIRDNPDRASWWAAQERAAQERARVAETGGRFRLGDSYEAMARDASQPVFPFMDDGDDYDAECGDMCGGDTPAEIAALQAEFERRVTSQVGEAA